MRVNVMLPLFVGLALVGCQGSPTPAPDAKAGEKAQSGGALTELKTEDVKVGTGDAAAEGDTVYMKYTGTLNDGTQFDSNDKPDGQPLSFALGPNSGMIQGWNKGIPGMKVGGKRKLRIPANLAYGPDGKGQIPPNTDLNFDVELLGLIKQGDENVVIKKDVKVGSGATVQKGSKVTVKYTGTLMTGKVFEDRTFSFTVGKGEVVGGFDAGMLGMKLGGVRELTVPPMAGFGPVGSPPAVGGNEILHFKITLVKVS
jgi:peptidylprolyl isomerase